LGVVIVAAWAGKNILKEPAVELAVT
jgi:hypothetical protein